MTLISVLAILTLPMLIIIKWRGHTSGQPVTSKVDAIVSPSHAVSPPVPQGRKAVIYGDVEDEPPIIESSQSSLTLKGMAFFIIYQASNGEITQRRIMVRHAVIKNNDVLVQAFCFERKKLRCFYASRMLEIQDIDTGEVSSDARQYLMNLMGYEDIPKAQDQKKTKASTASIQNIVECTNLLAPIQDEILALVYMARADGRMIKKERSIVVSYAVERVAEAAGHEQEIDKYVSKLYPDKTLFRDLLSKLLFLPLDRQKDIYIAMDHVMKANGVIHVGEMELLSIYRNELSKQIDKTSSTA